MAATVVQAIFGSYDIRIAKQWRDEDLVHRDQEVQWLNDDVVRKQQWRNADIERSLRCEKLRSEHRIIDARAEQLSVSSEQSALLCGFTIASMSNLGIPNDLSSYILFFFGVVSTIVVSHYSPCTNVIHIICIYIVFIIVCDFINVYGNLYDASISSDTLCIAYT
jgi:hypothetical protein